MKSQRNYFLNYHQVVCLGRAKEIHKSHSFSFGAVDKKLNLVNTLLIELIQWWTKITNHTLVVNQRTQKVILFCRIYQIFQKALPALEQVLPSPVQPTLQMQS